MAGRNDWEMDDIAARIRDAVSGALDSSNFDQLNRTISDTVNAALFEARQRFRRQPPDQVIFDEPDGPSPWRRPETENGAGCEGACVDRRRAAGGCEGAGADEKRRPEADFIRRVENPPSIRVNWNDQTAGILFSVFGGIGVGLFGLMALFLFSVSLFAADGFFGWSVAWIFAAVAVCFGIMLGLGIAKSGRAARLKRYLQEIKKDGKPYYEIRRLCETGGYDAEFIRKDLKRILKNGMLPDVRMDDDGTYLLLNEETYLQYRQAQESFRIRQEQQRQAEIRQTEPGRSGAAAEAGDSRGGADEMSGADRSGASAGAAGGRGKARGMSGADGNGVSEGSVSGRGAAAGLSGSTGDPVAADARDGRPETSGTGSGQAPAEAELSLEVREAVAKGEEFMDQLDQLRAAVPESEMTEKLIRLDRVLERLFETLRKYPDQLDELEKFMEYYLPTTVKLVTAYRDFAAVEFPGDNIRRAKQEIEKTMDTINGAFEKLLDDMYEDTAFDVMTDASVLQTMLAREGLTESDFRQ